MFCFISAEEHKCKKCGHVFREAESLKEHMMVHYTSQGTPTKVHDTPQGKPTKDYDTSQGKPTKVHDTLTKPKVHATLQAKPKVHATLQAKPKVHATLQAKPKAHATLQSKPKPCTHKSVTGLKKTDILSCNKCGKFMVNTTELSTHMRIHTGEKPYNCNKCDKTFRKSIQLRTHKLQHSSVDKPNLFKCPECHKGFPGKASLNTHVRSAHTTAEPGESDYMCGKCGKDFRHSGTLTKHMILAHKDVQLLSCKLCSQTFTSAAELVDHLTFVHAGSQPGKSHANIVTNQPTFSSGAKRKDSNAAPKQCTQQSQVVNKVKVETKKETTCFVCDKEMSSIGALTIHMMLHTGEKPYSCPFCEEKYRQKVHVQSHIQFRHPSKAKKSKTGCQTA